MTRSFENSGSLGYVTAVVGVGLVTAVSAVFDVRVNSTTAALGLLLIVLIVATLFGSRPALFASFIGVLSFNFFFLPPYFTWHIAEAENWVAFGAFLITAAIAGQLSSYARRRADESEARRQEIEVLYRDLQTAFEQASQSEALRHSEKLKSALLDAVTHDLRTPLTSIKASVTTLMEDAREGASAAESAISLDPESRAEFLEIINEETDRLNEFIGGMVDLAKIEAGKFHLRKTWSDISAIIDEATGRAASRLRDRRVYVELQEGLPRIKVDAASIAEVLYSLVDNAAKYSPENSEIRIGARISDEHTVEFQVENKGPGIEPHLRERVFEKFYRSSGGDIHTTASGLGLGLAIARGIVESQGGTIWIDGADLAGVTRFVFRIPIGHDRL